MNFASKKQTDIKKYTHNKPNSILCSPDSSDEAVDDQHN